MSVYCFSISILFLYSLLFNIVVLLVSAFSSFSFSTLGVLSVHSSGSSTSSSAFHRICCLQVFHRVGSSTVCLFIYCYSKLLSYLCCHRFTVGSRSIISFFRKRWVASTPPPTWRTPRIVIRFLLY